MHGRFAAKGPLPVARKLISAANPSRAGEPHAARFLVIAA